MSEVKKFRFKLCKTSDTPIKDIEILIKEVFGIQYSNYVWPSALVLCEFMCANHDRFRSKTIIELGSGTGICAIIAAKLGCKCFLTDQNNNLNLCKENVRLNKVNADIFALEWGTVYTSLPKIDYIIGSDCFYDESTFEDLLCTVSLLLNNSPGAIFYTAYQLRDSSHTIECLLRKWDLTCEMIQFESESQNFRQVIELYEIKKHSI